MQKLRSLIFNILFILNTAFWSILGTLSLLFPKKVLIFISYMWSYTTLLLLKYICNIRYEVKGLENIPQNENVIFASKHQSAWETIAYPYILKNNIFVFKKELAYIPFFGLTLLKAGNIMVDRGASNKTTLNKLIKKFKKTLKYRNIIIFPEGTRTLPNTTTKYKSGLSIIAHNIENKYVVPIAINSGIYWPKNGFIKKPGTIKVHILPAIKTGILSKEEFQKLLTQQIEDETKKL